MKSQSIFQQFSDPRAVFPLLGWLRLFMTTVLLIVAWFVDGIQHSGVSIDWHWLLPLSLVVYLLSAITFLFSTKVLKQSQLTMILAVDILLWQGLIVASGGSLNPGISYFLVLLAVAALSLQPKQVAVLTLLTIGLYAALMQTPINHHDHHQMMWHLWGMWGLFSLNAVLIIGVIYVLLRVLREKDQAIAQYREETVRSEQLVIMGALSANIAHELGTPLSTIAILAEGLEDEESKLIQAQIERCRKALSQLKIQDVNSMESSKIDSGDFLETLRHEIQLLQPDTKVVVFTDDSFLISVPLLLKHSLLSLLNNAAQASAQCVELSFTKEGGNLTFTITHDGEAIEEELLEKLGTAMVESSKDSLGIGYYLANASISRLGGIVSIYNTDKGVVNKVSFAADKLLVEAEVSNNG